MRSVSPLGFDPVSAILRSNRAVRRVTRQIVLEQDKLRATVTARAWRIYLRIEELSNGRLVLLTNALLRERSRTHARDEGP